ncbi:diguanylate cyclase [Micromonospora sp. NPDC003197]
MRLDHERIIRDVVARLSRATSVLAACQATVAALGQRTPARISVLLLVRDQLRCVSATGAWQVPSGVAPGIGAVGRVYVSGKTETVFPEPDDSDHLLLPPGATAQLCAPIRDSAGCPIGVLDLVWSSPVDLDQWPDSVERIATTLGVRIEQLGGAPVESRSERTLRHSTALTTAVTERELAIATTEAARDIAGFSAAILVLTRTQGLWVGPATIPLGVLEARVRAGLAEAGQPALERIHSWAHRYGAACTIGDAPPSGAGADYAAPPLPAAEAGYAPLIAAGVGTLIIVPFGKPETGGVLLVADERQVSPESSTLGLVELLAAQVWACLDRLSSLAKLHELATSDPLTGLRHHGPFGERIAAATPGRTALLAIDVDDFKVINDTYGHQVGDQVLVDLARALEAALRQGDELYRIGGDEFVAVIEVARPEEAVGIAERLAEAARRIDRTISVGVALRHDGEPPELTLRRADEALYGVKREGRDGVRLAPA